MAGVAFKIRGNQPPFNVDIKESTITGPVVETRIVPTSGSCQTFTSLLDDQQYYVVVSDNINKITQTNFTTPPSPLSDIYVSMNETYRNLSAYSDEYGYFYNGCSCNTITNNPALSSGDSYDVNLCGAINQSTHDFNLGRIGVYCNNTCIGGLSIGNSDDDPRYTFNMPSISVTPNDVLDVRQFVENNVKNTIDSCVVINGITGNSSNYYIGSPDIGGINNNYQGTTTTSTTTSPNVMVSIENTYSSPDLQSKRGVVFNTPPLSAGQSYDITLNVTAHADYQGTGLGRVDSDVTVKLNGNIVPLLTISTSSNDGEDAIGKIFTLENIIHTDVIEYEINTSTTGNISDSLGRASILLEQTTNDQGVNATIEYPVTDTVALLTFSQQ